MKMTYLLAWMLSLGIVTSTPASIILGTGQGSLLGGDLTDPEDDGIDSTGDLPNGASSGMNFNWVATSSNDRNHFGDPIGTGGIRQGALDVFDNEVGGDINSKWCCSGPNGFGGALHVTVEFANMVQLTHFTLTSGGDVPDRRPTVFAIQGSNDGTSFTNIFAQNAPTTSLWTANSQVIRFDSDTTNPGDPDFTTPTGYRFIRYEVTNTLGGGAAHQLEEIEYFGNVIPEPASASLLGLGFALIGLRRFAKRS